MPQTNPVLDIQARFVGEQEYIQRFLRFLTTIGSLRDEQVGEVSRILHSHGLPELPERRYPRRFQDPYLHEESAAVGAAIERIRPAVERAIADAQAHLNQLEVPQGLNTVDMRSPIGEWIEYFVGALEFDVSPASIQRAIEEARQMQAQVIRDLGRGAVRRVSRKQVQYSVDCAVYILARRTLTELLHVQDRLAEFDLSHRLVSPETELNALRQGFLLLMTAFDAAVFDLFRAALSRDFFGRIALLGGKDKIPLSQFGKYRRFDAFCDDVIEDQLRSRYLKDLLYILQSSGVTCVDESAGDRFVDLVELVLRRNIHVHNRGIVDERYLERDDDGTPRYNICSLQLGAVAVIDQVYWERANRLCQICVRRVTEWAGQ